MTKISLISMIIFDLTKSEIMANKLSPDKIKKVPEIEDEPRVTKDATADQHLIKMSQKVKACEIEKNKVLINKRLKIEVFNSGS